MSGSKIRNIALAALLLVNLLFLYVIIDDAAEDSRVQREAVENISAILSAGGVSINPDDIAVVSDGMLRTMRTTRVPEVEEIIAHALLGEAIVTDRGIIYVYENPQMGRAEFYSGGVFSVSLLDGAVSNGGDTFGAVSLLLSEMQIEAMDLVISVHEGDSVERALAVVAYDGSRVFNSFVEFIFIYGSLRYVNGRYVAGVEQAYESSYISQVSSALLAFLSAVRDYDRPDISCYEIFEIQAGFLHRVAGTFGEGLLEPAWQVITDNGRFLIDDTTREIWRLA
ncbi:MAG: hypothetical protein FWB75_06020 [Oscillospiraceae bacterium]|nr:hypothetical protein [Oscillospiraceae bacterium]